MTWELYYDPDDREPSETVVYARQREDGRWDLALAIESADGEFHRDTMTHDIWPDRDFRSVYRRLET